MMCMEYELKISINFRSIFTKMDILTHKTFCIFQRTLNIQCCKPVRSCARLCQYYSSFSKPLRKTAFFKCSDRQQSTRLNNTRQTFSSQSLVWEEDGQTLIRSPHKDVVVPQMSFAEYMFSKLDEFKHLECMVSQVPRL